MKYSEKLKDPRWQKKRLEILQRDNFTCQLCEDKTTTLHIHHKKYTGEPWEAPEEDLVTLCEHCHEYIACEGELLSKIIAVKKIIDSTDGEITLIIKTEKGIAFIVALNNSSRLVAVVPKQYYSEIISLIS